MSLTLGKDAVADAIAENVVVPARLNALRERVEGVLGLYARAHELGYFVTARPPRPVTHAVVSTGHCDECCKQRPIGVDVTMEMFEDWLGELEAQVAAIAKTAEAKALVALEEGPRKPILKKPRRGR